MSRGSLGSMREIAASAGVTTGSAYSHFAAKAELMSALVTRILDRHALVLIPEGGIRQLTAATLRDLTHNESDAARLLVLVWGLLIEDRDGVAEQIRERLERNRSHLTDVVRRALEIDGVAPDEAAARARAAADALIGFLQMLAVQIATMTNVDTGRMVRFASDAMELWAK